VEKYQKCLFVLRDRDSYDFWSAKSGAQAAAVTVSESTRKSTKCPDGLEIRGSGCEPEEEGSRAKSLRCGVEAPLDADL